MKRKPGSTPQTSSQQQQHSHTPTSNTSKPSSSAQQRVTTTSLNKTSSRGNAHASSLSSSFYSQPTTLSSSSHHHATSGGGAAGYISPSISENQRVISAAYPYCSTTGESFANSGNHEYHHLSNEQQQQQFYQTSPDERHSYHDQYYRGRTISSEMHEVSHSNSSLSRTTSKSSIPSSSYSQQQQHYSQRLSSSSSYETPRTSPMSRDYLYHPYAARSTSSTTHHHHSTNYHSEAAHHQPSTTYTSSPPSYHSDYYANSIVERGSGGGGGAVSPMSRSYYPPENAHPPSSMGRMPPYVKSTSPPYHTSPSNELYPDALMPASHSSHRRESKHSLPSHRYHPYVSSTYTDSSQKEGLKHVVNSSLPSSEVATSRNLPYGVVSTGVAVPSQETGKREARASHYDPLRDNSSNHLHFTAMSGVSQNKQEHRNTENDPMKDSKSKLPSVKDLLNFPSESNTNTDDPSGFKKANNPQNEINRQSSFFSKFIDDTAYKKLPKESYMSMTDGMSQMEKFNLMDISQQRMVDIILSFVTEKVPSESFSTRMSIPRHVTLSDLRENINERARKCYLLEGCNAHIPNVGNILLTRDERNFIEIDDNFCLSNRFENNDMLKVVMQSTE